MALNQKTIYVYESFNSDESNLMGRLYVGEGKGSDNFSFEFDADWLAQYDRSRIIDPELQFYSGRQYPVNKSIFGIFADSSPDRWGRVLMQRRRKGQRFRRSLLLLRSRQIRGTSFPTRNAHRLRRSRGSFRFPPYLQEG